MRNWTIVLLMSGIICCMAFVADAATVVSYTASDSPGSAPDANGNSVDVWTVTGDGGASRSFRANQDGNTDVWGIWDLNGGGGTYATHNFAGGALKVGQSVSIDWAHNRNIEGGRSIGIRFLDGSSNQVALVFQGGKLVFSRYDTATGIYTDIVKYYDRYDIFQVVFTLTGNNSYVMSITEGSIADNTTGLGNDADDGNPNVGDVVDFWTGSFTGSAITGIQVYTEGGNDSDQWFDNLVINDDWINKPHNQFPSQEQEDVIVSGLELSWGVPQVYSPANPEVLVADPNLVSFNLRYTTDPNLDAATPISITAWDAGTLRAAYVPSTELTKNATYYWRVDSVMDYGVVEGDEWVFYTELTRAIIESGPVYQIVDPGSTAVFSVVVSSDSPEFYQWYKYVDGINDTLLADGGDISGAATAELSIANVELADEGQYYCVVNNDSGIAVESETALLGMKRKIAYWPFDGGALDSTIAGSPVSVVVGDPNLASESILGDAIEFDNGVDMLYTDPDQTSYFDICDYEMTVACWVKTTDNQSWAALVSRNGEANGWQLRQSGFTGNRPCFTTRTQGTTDNDDGTPANRTIYDGQWHYVVATLDGTVKKVYIDGVVSRSYSGDTGSFIRDADAVTTPIRRSLSPVAIGSRVFGNVVDGLNVDTGAIVAGIYDEVEIYNYALDAAIIAQTYADLSGTNVCLTQTYDLDNDCFVNLNDLGLLASEWLNNQLFEPMP